MKWNDLVEKIKASRLGSIFSGATTPPPHTPPNPPPQAAPATQAVTNEPASGGTPIWNNKWVVTAALAAAFVVVFYPDVVRDRIDAVITTLLFPAADEGLILLETPQVFTRGRLVNDRATEHAWLKNELARSEELLKNNQFAAPDFIRFARQNFKLAISPGASGNQAQPSKGAPPDGSAPSGTSGGAKDELRERLAKLGLSVPPLDQLEDAIRYRDAIRNALMSTALDDRHDIDGNTVYRFNFNVALVPPRGSDRLAVVIAELSEVQEPTKRADTYVEIIHDWRDKLELELQQSIEDRINTILRGTDLEAEVHAVFELALAEEIDEQFARYLLAKGNTPLEKEERQELSKLIQQRRGDFRQIASRARLEFKKAHSENQREFLRSLLGSVSPRLRKHAEALPGIEGRLDWIVDRCSPNEPMTLESLELTLALQKIVEESKDRLRCPPKTSVLVPIIDVLDTLMVLNDGPASTPERCSKPAELQEVLRAAVTFDRTKRPSGCAQVGQQARERRLADGWVERTRDRIGWITAKVISAMQPRANLTTAQNPPEEIRLSSFFDIQRPQECSPGFCKPIVRIKDALAAKRLMDTLERRTSVFTYAVSPNRSVQRHEVATRSSADLSAGSDGPSLLQGLAKAAVDSETFGISRDPVIIGFGDWDKVPNESSRTKFGWVMFAKSSPGSYFVKRQSAENHSVSALISIPGWWKMVRLGITTCWISESNLVKTSDPKKVCPTTNTRKNYEFDTRLPGDASELMQNLRFTVITNPYIASNPNQPLPEVEVGRKASVLIRGGRLWRSPVVRLGSQEANEVEVLPDMRGIIARFNCVYPAAGTAGGMETQNKKEDSEPTVGRIQVYTSEGTTVAAPIRRNPYKKRLFEPERPCWLDDKPSPKS